MEKYQASLVAILDEKTLRQIDEARAKDPKHVVRLKLELALRVIESQAEVAHFFIVSASEKLGRDIKVTKQSGMEVGAAVVTYVHDPEYNTPYNNGWIISGRQGPTFLSIKMQKVECIYRIPSADWITDYAPKLGLGRRIVFEVPSEGELFRKTLTYLSKAEDALLRWDTKGVFSNCREIGTLLDNHIKQIYGQDSFVHREKWGRAFERFKHWASFDLHIEDLKQKYISDDVSAGRADSENLLLSTKVLIKYAQELSESHRLEE